MATHSKDLATFDLPCWIYKPDGFDGASTDTYSVLIFLHGSGVTGRGIDDVITRDAPTPASEANTKLNTTNFDHNFIILSPYLDSGDWFVGVIRNFLDSVITNKDSIKADITKIALTGLSLGGIGISAYIQNAATNNNYRDLIAAFPVAGGSQSSDNEQDAVDRNILVKGWMGENDPSSFANPRMIDDASDMNAIQAGYYELFTVPGGTHSPNTWGKVYNRQDANAVSFDIYSYMSNLLDTTPPTVPSGLVSSNIKPNSFTVSWNTSTDAESGTKEYNIYINDILTYTTELTFYNFDRLIPNTVYEIKISAVDNLQNESNLSTLLSVTTLQDLAQVSNKSINNLLI